MGKGKKAVVTILLCTLLLLSGLFWGYQKHRVKPFSSVLPLSRDEVTEVDLRTDGEYIVLDAQQQAAFFDALDGCTVKFQSASSPYISNSYASAVLCIAAPPPGGDAYPEMELIFSYDDRVAINVFDSKSKYLTIYTFIDGSDVVYQLLSELSH